MCHRGQPVAGPASARTPRLIRLLWVLTVPLSVAAPKPAWTQAFAHEMTCEQAIAHYEATGMIFVMANERFAVPVRIGVPISQAASLLCPDGNSPRPYTVRTRDVRRCSIAMHC